MKNGLESELKKYIDAICGKQINELVALDVRGLTSVADAFLICSGRSHRHVSAIAEHIRLELKKDGINPLSVEGKRRGHWIILDYDHVVIHVFYEPVRVVYDLEGFWADAPRIETEDMIKRKMEKTYRQVEPMINEIRPCVLIILDGWGLRESSENNAVKMAETPFMDQLLDTWPHTRLACSGEAVGLPRGVMGNSEVGHMNIGAGRVVFQNLLRINQAIADGSFVENSAFNRIMTRVRESHGSLHLMGLLSDGGVHSHIDHLQALLTLARDRGLERVFVHAILDGRDTPPKSGATYIRQLQDFIGKIKFGAIASICGRYYAMDRDTRWERVEQAYRLYTQGEGIVEPDPEQAVMNAYARNETDEFVKPIVISDLADHPPGSVTDGDGIIFYNFRSDRAREITRAFTDPDFSFFDRARPPKLSDYVCMTLYDANFTLPLAFPPVHLDDILGEIVSRQGLYQLRIAETEKYAHVTYFFNGGEETPFEKEDRCLIPSPREVNTYDEKPEMSAPEVTREMLKRLDSGRYAFIALNFANMDMVGHTGILEAAIKACETVDACLASIVTRVLELEGTVLITADHGNSETMMDENGQPHTAHTLNPVRLVLVDENLKTARLREGVLGDIAPTILDIMGIEQPERMTGHSLIVSQ